MRLLSPVGLLGWFGGQRYRVRRGGAPTAALAGLWFLFSCAPRALPGELEEAAHMEQAAAPQPGCPRHCGNTGKGWASGAALWHQRGLFLQE